MTPKEKCYDLIGVHFKESSISKYQAIKSALITAHENLATCFEIEKEWPIDLATNIHFWKSVINEIEIESKTHFL